MFQNREEAGRLLAEEIEKQIKERDFTVVAIVRGGIVLGRVIADYFNVPLEALIIRKIGAPSSGELAIGALGPKGTVYWAEDLIESLNVDDRYKVKVMKEKSSEIERLYKILRRSKESLDFVNKKVIVVDDGVATGATVMCGYKFLKKEEAKLILLATPVISKDTFDYVSKYYDKIIALEVVDNFYAVGQFYKDFPQVEDKEAKRLL